MVLIVSTVTAVKSRHFSSLKHIFAAASPDLCIKKMSLLNPCLRYLSSIHPSLNQSFCLYTTTFSGSGAIFVLSNVCWSVRTLRAAPPSKLVLYLPTQNAVRFPFDWFCRYGSLRRDLYPIQHHQQAQQALNLGCCLVTSPWAVRLTMNRHTGPLFIFFFGVKIYSLGLS